MVVEQVEPLAEVKLNRAERATERVRRIPSSHRGQYRVHYPGEQAPLAVPDLVPALLRSHDGVSLARARLTVRKQERRLRIGRVKETFQKGPGHLVEQLLLRCIRSKNTRRERVVSLAVSIRERHPRIVFFLRP